MKYTAFLIKYAEIAIKGKNRGLFEDALVRQIKYALKRCEGEFAVTKASGRVYIECTEGDPDPYEVAEKLKCVFGITGICPVVHVEDEGFDRLSEDVLSYLEEFHLSGDRETSSHKPPRTFKVNARRARKDYPLNSQEINMELGGRILERFPGLRVDVHDPELWINIEIRERIYIYSTTIPGPGGMPVGTNGKGMLLLSGGIDSPVAGYMIAKRGVKIDAVYFHAPPYTSERAKQKVVDLARILSKYTGPIYLHVINFTDIQMEIYEKCPKDELTIIMRRYMMRIAEELAKETECLGLITGESIGQVASQTMQSLAATNDVCTMPVYRPLIGFDKQEIIHISERIGTYETSILPFEDCCTIFVAKHPVTKPKVSIIRRSERRLTAEAGGRIEELYRKAMESDEVIIVR